EYLDIEETRAQQMIPHYFEKYRTDGVEFEIYAGQSLLKSGTFSPVHLKNLRLWQLVTVCEITRLVERLGQQLPVPLKTAQLVFVFNNPIAIRFRLDEKRFDVDGAYNIRYEIIKKRIDKAYIEGTRERLTQPGKIAIVYAVEADRQEYEAYLQHLIREGYIEPEIEDLALGKLQGVQGLRALRVRVKAAQE
ncbi:MAG: GAF domain-containing protein, partial [Bacteroidetes bacterium]